MWPKLFFATAFLVLVSAWFSYLLGVNDQLLSGLITATIAAASIVYSLGSGRDAARDQYTLSLIARRFDDGDYARNVRIASDLKRDGSVTADTTIAVLMTIFWTNPHDKKDVLKAAYAIIPILNYWEHVCTAYVDNRINRSILEDLVQDLIREMVARYPGVIGSMRAESPDNLDHLCTVWFVVASDEERDRLCSRLGAVPHRLCHDDRFRWVRSAQRHE